MSKKGNNRDRLEPDYFARVTAIIGLAVGVMAIIIPIWHEHQNEQERLSVWMRVNQNDIVLIPNNRKKSTVIQIPWLFTLSNTGKVKLSIIGYDILKIESGGLSRFPNLVGPVNNIDGTPIELPITLDAGESKTIRIYLGFRAEPIVLEKLYELYKRSGAFTVNESFKYLAKFGLTIYGGKAEYKNIYGGLQISIDSDFYQREPVYRVEFQTGRGNRFYIQGSETISRFSS